MLYGSLIEKLLKMLNKIKQKKFTLGGWVTIGHPIVAEIMSNAGFDWVVVDLEHSATDLEKAADLIRTIDLSGVMPIVRLTSNDPDQIKRMMDSGAQGIIVPNVNTMQSALEAVMSTRYAPIGSRGVGLGRANKYGVKFSEYFEWQKTEPVVIVMIENKAALGNIDSILEVEGVDGFLVGPYDLSASLGVPGDFENSIFTDAINYIKNAGIRHQCITGLHIVEPDINLLKRSVAEGFNFIAYSVDIRILDVFIRAGVKCAKEII